MPRITDKEINIRIISVIFAVVLWLYVASEQNPMEYKNIKDVPVRMTNLEFISKSGLVVKDEQDYKVDVTLQGKRSVLTEVKAGDIMVEADLRGFNQKGVNSIPVEVKGIPSNVELVDFNPKNIKVTLEPIVSVQVPVNVVTAGKPRSGYTALQPGVTPGEVLVKGSESMLKDVKVQTATLKLEGAASDIKEVLPVKVIDQDGNEVTGVEVNPNIVEVTVPVRSTKEVRVDIIFQGQPAQGREITGVLQDRETVVIYGEQSLLDSIDKITTQPVDLSGIEDDTRYKVELILPEGVSVIDGINKVEVYVQIEKIITREISVDKVSFINIAKGLKIADDTKLPPVKIRMEGKEGIINSITTNDINIYADLKDLSRGSHTVTLQVDLPQGTLLKDLEPQKIELELVSANGSV
jgi:YbbR domain-containing protein